MRIRIVSLSLLVLVLAGLSARSASANPVTQICDEGGNCGSCCTSGADCVAWCEDHCPSSASCAATPNAMCCGAGGLSIECGGET